MNILTIKAITKNFRGIKAIDDLSLEIRKGELASLMGPNGSGKTTVFNVITGLLKTNSGDISFEGNRLNGLAPYKIARAGIGRTFQLIRLCPQMTVLENVQLAMRYPIGESLFFAVLRPCRLASEELTNREKALKLLEQVRILHKKNSRCNELSHGERRLVEIARALALDPKLLLLDEPMSGLSPQMATRTMQIILSLRNEGRTILFIEHNMKVVLELSDRVIVLDHGRKIAEGTPCEIMNNRHVSTAYLGRSRSGAS